MSIIDDVKELADLVKERDDIELYRKLVELERSVFELDKEKFLLERRVHELEKQLRFKGTLTFKAPVYYAEGDEIPYCPKCWETAEQAVHLTHQHDNKVRVEAHGGDAGHDTAVAPDKVLRKALPEVRG